MSLHGPRGDVNGAMMKDDPILRVPPPEAERLATFPQPGADRGRGGTEWTNPIGKMFEVRQLAASRGPIEPDSGAAGPRPRWQERPARPAACLISGMREW